MWKPDRGPASPQPRLVSEMGTDTDGNPDAKPRKAKPNHHRGEPHRSFDSLAFFVKTVLRLLLRKR